MLTRDKNRSTFGEVMGKSRVSCFFYLRVKLAAYMLIHLLVWRLVIGRVELNDQSTATAV